MKTLILSLLVFCACCVHAALSVATVDMNLVVLAHPQTASNRVELVAMQKKFIAEADAAREAGQKIMDQFRLAVLDMRNEALSDSKRKAARAKAEDLQVQIEKAEKDLRLQVADRRRTLRQREMVLFDQVMDDIKAKLGALSKARSVGLVLDASAERAAAPIPMVVYADAAFDLTDALIEATGGDRKRAEEDLSKANMLLFGDDEEEERK